MCGGGEEEGESEVEGEGGREGEREGESEDEGESESEGAIKGLHVGSRRSLGVMLGAGQRSPIEALHAQAGSHVPKPDGGVLREARFW